MTAGTQAPPTQALPTRRADVAIVGGGMVGATLALLLAQQACGERKVPGSIKVCSSLAPGSTR